MGRDYADDYFDPVLRAEVYDAVIAELNEILDYADTWFDNEEFIEYITQRRDELVQFSSEVMGYNYRET